MQHPELTAFVEHARERGLDPLAIRMLLLSAGWKERQIAQALSAQALELPIPTPPDTGGARDAFLHLLTFAAFYTAAVSLILLFFTYINLALPDPAFDRPAQLGSLLSTIRGSMAALIVAFPLYLGLTRYLVREMRTRPEKAAGGVRRWLTYLTLFAAAATLMCDLIVLVFHLLEGELSLRFLFKVLVVGVLATTAFLYYLLSLRVTPAGSKPRRLHPGFAALATGLVLIAVVWGAFHIGPPTTQRLRKLDERRLADLQQIHNEVQNHVFDRNPYGLQGDRRLVHPLPPSLEAAASLAHWERPNVRDPETGEPYEYEVLGKERYRLCAEFRLARDERSQPRWNHPAGRHCFDFDVKETGPQVR